MLVLPLVDTLLTDKDARHPGVVGASPSLTAAEAPNVDVIIPVTNF
jgi:hypothetical protein